MAFWTVIGRGIEGDVQGKTFGVTLDTSADTWTVGGASVDKFFITRSGAFKIVGIPENGTQLVSASKAEAAFFKALNSSSAVGSTGTGRAPEKGVNFEWTLDSK